MPLVKIQSWNRGASWASRALTPGRSLVHIPMASSWNSERSCSGQPASSSNLSSSSCTPSH